MDVKRNVSVSKSINADAKMTSQFINMSGIYSSFLEHSVPQQLLSSQDEIFEGISAVKALQIANNAGIIVHTIDRYNIDSILPQLQVDADVIYDIQNAVNAGKTVIVSRNNIDFNNWRGCGYIILDPNTGTGAYMISGGYAGSQTPDKGNTYWSAVSSIFASIRLRNMVIQEAGGMENVGRIFMRKIGITALACRMLVEIIKINDDDTLSDTQRYASYYTILITFFASLVAMFVPLGVTGSALYLVTVNFLFLTAVLFTLGFIEQLVLEGIREAGS